MNTLYSLLTAVGLILVGVVIGWLASAFKASVIATRYADEEIARFKKEFAEAWTQTESDKLVALEMEKERLRLHYNELVTKLEKIVPGINLPKL